MFYDIITLDPNSYVKKTKKSNNFKETDEFIDILHRKFIDWNIKFVHDGKVGVAHKLKYDQFENYFYKQSHFILYVVGLSSEEYFRDSVKKLISTCRQVEKLSRVIVLSLDTNSFVELNNCAVNLVYFGNNTWRSEEDDIWKEFETNLRTKLHSSECNDTFDSSNTNSLTLPLPIPKRKSSFKSFFNSLPAKFELDKRKYIKDKSDGDGFNESVPNIKISDSNLENALGTSERKDIGLRHKEDHTKLSLNSLFRKRSRKTRDSGLSVGSSISNGSDGRKSDTFSVDKTKSVDPMFSLSNEPSPSCERSAVLCSSTLQKTKTYKAKIHMFKDKASKVFQSANCLNSPDNKRRKQIEDSSFTEVPFNSHQIRAFSDILIGDLNTDSKSPNMFLSYAERGHSEPPIGGPVPQNGKIKYYSWNTDLSTSQELILDKLTCNSPEIQTSLTEPKHHVFDDPINGTLILMNQVDDEDKYNYRKEMNSDIIDEKYFQVQYAPSTESSPMKTSKPSVTFKIEGLDSLENIMESIQKSCDELKVKSKTNGNNDNVLQTFKIQTEKSSTNKRQLDDTTDLLESMQTRGEYSVIQRNYFTNETIPVFSFVDETCPAICQITAIQIIPDSTQDQRPSFLYRSTRIIINNPFVVMSLLTATALTAPVWSTYMPYKLDISQIVYTMTSRILNTGMIRSVPNQLISSTAAVTNTLRRYLVSIPNLPSFSIV